MNNTNERLIERLQRTANSIQEFINGEWQGEEGLQAIVDGIYQTLKESEPIQETIRAIWSMDYDLEDKHNLNCLKIEYPACEAWGRKTTYATIEGDLWGNVFEACERAIQESGDGQHVFIEALVFDKNNNVLVLSTGS